MDKNLKQIIDNNYEDKNNHPMLESREWWQQKLKENFSSIEDMSPVYIPSTYTVICYV